jgi:hypothetical protein
VGTTSKPEVQARSKSGDVLWGVMYSERVIHEAAAPTPIEASCLEEKGGRIATEVSRLATRRTRFPLSSKISTGTQPKTKTSQQRLEAAIFRVLGRGSGPVVGSQASIKGTTSLSSVELARRLGVASMLVTGTRADTCGTKYHHRSRGGGMDTACKDTH